MAIPEPQLETWSHQGSKVQSASTYETIKQVLDDPAAPYHRERCYRIFLQGSYGNDTNIYSDSDVDIAICLTSTYYHDTSNLDVNERQRFKANTSSAAYDYFDFKKDVLAWLTHKFGTGVKAGKKAIFVPGNGNRRDADVLVCAQHRSYFYYDSEYANRHREGITFWTSSRDQIVNYPKQHLENSMTKHQATGGRFKPSIRIIKNMRSTMIDRGLIEEGLAPSYFLEGMLSNVPTQNFVTSRQQTFENYISWLQTAPTGDMTCANGIHYLLRDGHSVCWNVADYNTFRARAIQFWNGPQY